VGSADQLFFFLGSSALHTGKPESVQVCLCYTLLLLHPFNGLFSRTTCVSRHQKGKPFWILLEQEMMGWQWHQQHHMEIICTSLQTDNHPVPHHSVFYRSGALPAAQPTVSVHSIHTKSLDVCMILGFPRSSVHSDLKTLFDDVRVSETAATSA